MKRLLPVFFISLFVFLTVIFPQTVSAQVQAQPAPNAVPTGGLWVVDPEVTFIGKNAARAGLMLDWTLRNYNWVCVNKVNVRTCDNSNNPIAKFWGTIVLYIVVPLLFLVILATAIVIIITRGKSLTIMRFIPRFVAVILLIVFSYSIIQFLYQFTDLIQGFFLQSQPTGGSCPPNCISQTDLLYVGWDYTKFIGLRLLGDYNAESAFISLLLTKLTALTYFVMIGILLMRKIILWFFIIVSPIFPLLLLYYPVRNTGKIWIGEFFRWLLYAPLFAIFLKGLVFMWRNQIPLVFSNPNINNPNAIIFPTAVNILLGGPRQFVTPTNSVNLTETFALYVVALIMLWIVILLPWILLQIFLDYAANFAPGDSAVMKTLVNLSNKQPPPGGGTSPVPPGGGGGAAVSLPFAKKFSIPVNLQPGGAAKEIIREKATESRFAQPTFLPTAQVNAQVLSLANLTLPSMRDIAKYETALMSRDSSQRQEVERVRETISQIATPVQVEVREKLSQESQQGNILATSILNAVSSMSQQTSQATTSQIQNILQQIANPASTTNVVDRERMTNIHEMLQRESKENNSQLAQTLLSVTERTSANEIEKIREQLKESAQQANSITSSVLSQITSAQQSSENSREMRSVLRQIANPSTSNTTVERERFSKLHDQLAKESSESNNTLATSILQVNDKTTTEQLEKIKEQLYQSRDSTIASSVLSTVNNAVSQQQQTTRVKSVLQQVANPQSAVNPVDREKLSKLHEALSKSSQEGNDLATSILAVNAKTSNEEIQKLQEKIMQAKEKGQPLANQIADFTKSATQANVPLVNRVQTVTQDDYQAVKDMWKQNYHNLEVPEGMAGTRSEWIKDDIAKIDEIVGMLSSSDQDKVNQGLQEVSNILPFLLVGGFSQTEIIAYLKAKQDAAKEVATELTAEEEEKVSVEVHHATAAQTMAVEQPSASTREDITIPTTQIQTTNIVTPQVSNEILAMVNLKLPRMRDVARYETMSLSRDRTKTVEVQKMNEVLERIANPSTVTVSTERERYEKLREKLMDESQKGNITAQVILSAASGSLKSGMTTPQAVHVKSVLQQIANPSLAASYDKDRYVKLHDELDKASKEGNGLASSILSITDKTPMTDIEKLSTQLKDAKQKGESIASSVLSSVSPAVAVPTVNRIQTVSAQEYEEVKNMWRENYQKLEVPEGMGGNRIDWIKDDIAKIDQVVGLLTSEDQEKVSQGIDEVSNILPFLLVGGFSQAEIVSYLKAKQDAAKEVLTTITKEEEETTVTVEKKEAHTQQVMTVEQQSEDEQETVAMQAPTAGFTAGTQPQVSSGVLAMANLTLPRMADIVKYETSLLSRDKSAATEASKVTEVLEHIANPSPIAVGVERERYEKLRERLVEESQGGNNTADTILSAAQVISKKADELVATVAELKTVMQQIAHTELAPESDRDFYTRLHDYLVREGKENNNELASKLLSVSDASPVSEIESIREQLLRQRKENQAAAKVIEAVNRYVELKQMKTLFVQLSDPSSAVSSNDRERLTKVRDALQKASEQGNQLAQAILALKRDASYVDIEKVNNQLKEAQQKKDPIAEKVLSQAGYALFSVSNRSQQVSQQDYDEVKKMWEDNYKNLPVPMGFSDNQQGRIDWIRKEADEMLATINLLQALDTQKREEGLKKVATILPFLLLGGFSYQEMVGYLQAKLDAAKSALANLAKDEGQKEAVFVSGQKPEQQKEMQAEETEEKKQN